MADISLTCGDCGHETVCSEFAVEEKRVCRACGGRLSGPPPGASGAAPGRGLKVKSAAAPSAGGSLSGRREIPADRYRAQRERQRPRGYSALLGLLVTVLCAGVWVGWQWLARQDVSVRSAYMAGRYVLLGVAAAFVLWDAFRESGGQGLLALLVPPYLVFYTLTHVESYWRRGLLLGAVIGLLAELHFMPPDAMLIRAQRSLDRGIEWVGGHVKRAGEDPFY